METLKEKLIERCNELFNEEDYNDSFGISPHEIFKNMNISQKEKTREVIMDKLHQELYDRFGYHLDDLNTAFRIYNDCKYVINNTINQ